MVKVDLLRQKPEKVGTAYTYSAESLQAYAEQVEKFIRDAPESLRHNRRWLDTVVTNLTKFGKNKAGKITGGSPLMNAFFSQRVLKSLPQGRNLITGEQLFRLYKQEDNKNPFRDVYVDFGIAIRPDGKKGYEPNIFVAKQLINDLKERNINTEKGVVPDFYMLDIDYSNDCGYGLILKLNDLTPKEINSVEQIPWDFKSDNPLALACLDRYSDWGSGHEDLEDSNVYTRVVGFDAEGVAPKNLPVSAKPRKPDTSGFDKAIKKVQDYKASLE